MRALTKKQTYWKKHLEAAQSFDGSLADYARAHDLSTKKLYVYKTQIRKYEEAAGVSAGFVKVNRGGSVTTPAAAPLPMSLPRPLSAPVTVSLPNGVRLTLPNLDVPGLLEQLARL